MTCTSLLTEYTVLFYSPSKGERAHKACVQISEVILAFAYVTDYASSSRQTASGQSKSSSTPYLICRQGGEKRT
jgi:hypothetical protein